MTSRITNAGMAVVPRSKVEDYLLLPGIPESRGKVGFFTRVGFTRQEWTALRDALLRHVREHSVAGETRRPFGVHYRVEGPMATPDGRQPMVRSVWIVRHGASIPEFLTACPMRSRKP